MITTDYDNTVIDTGHATFKYSIIRIFKTKIPNQQSSTSIIYYLYTPTTVSSHNEHLQIFIFKVLAAEFLLHCTPTIKAGDWS